MGERKKIDSKDVFDQSIERIPDEVFARRQGKVPLKTDVGYLWVSLDTYLRFIGFGLSGSGDIPMSIEPRVSGED